MQHNHPLQCSVHETYADNGTEPIEVYMGTSNLHPDESQRTNPTLNAVTSGFENTVYVAISSQ